MMSIEALVLLIFFVLLPLVQQLLQAARQRDSRIPERSAGPPASGPQQAPTAAPGGLVTSMPVLVQGAPLVNAAGTARIPLPAGVRTTPVPLGLRPRPRTRGRYPLVNAHNRFDLRRAIVFTAILGPGRAMARYDWSEHYRNQ